MEKAPGLGEAAIARVLAVVDDLELAGNVRELRNLLARTLAAPEVSLISSPIGQTSRAKSTSTTREIPDFKSAKEALVADFEMDYFTGF